MELLSIVFATLFQYVFGMIWYSRILLGLLWASYLEGEDGVSETGLKRFNPARAKSHIIALVTAIAIATVEVAVLTAMSVENIVPALLWSLGLWLAFLALPTLTEYQYAKRSLVLWAIDQGYYLGAIAGSAVLIVLL